MTKRQRKNEGDRDKEREQTREMCIPLACLAREHRRRVAGCSVYYPQAIWVGKLLGRGGMHVCVCVCVCQGKALTLSVIILTLCLLSPTIRICVCAFQATIT